MGIKEMPATAPPVWRSANNRLSVSDSLKTHDVWQKSVGYDPYAGNDEAANQAALVETGEINSPAKGLFRLAQLTGNSSTLAPGACKRCGQVGHLFYQCRNNFKLGNKPNPNEQLLEEEEDDEDPPSDAVESSEDDDSSDDDDSDDDEESADDDSSKSSSDSDSDSSSSSSS